MRNGLAMSALMLGMVFGSTGTFAAGPEAASPWLKKFHSKTRLISGTVEKPGANAKPAVGIHVTLDWGWKTYWRTPGDAGIPPAFSWKGSKNLKSAKVLWPAPKRFADPAGSSIGYVSEVVLPVVLEPEDPSKPVAVQLRLDYAICKDICAPAQSDMSLVIPPASAGQSPNQDLLARYLGRVPVPVAAKQDVKPRITAFSADVASKKPHLAIEAEFAPGSGGEDVFVEGPPEVYIPLAKRVAETADGRMTFRVELEPGPELKGLKGKELTLTLVSKKGQSETRKTVD